jgi:hypothetical protein
MSVHQFRSLIPPLEMITYIRLHLLHSSPDRLLVYRKCIYIPEYVRIEVLESSGVLSSVPIYQYLIHSSLIEHEMTESGRIVGEDVRGKYLGVTYLCTGCLGIA